MAIYYVRYRLTTVWVAVHPNYVREGGYDLNKTTGTSRLGKHAAATNGAASCVDRRIAGLNTGGLETLAPVIIFSTHSGRSNSRPASTQPRLRGTMEVTI